MSVNPVEPTGSPTASSSSAFNISARANESAVSATVDKLTTSLAGTIGRNSETAGARDGMASTIKSALTDMVAGGQEAAAAGKSPFENERFMSGLERLLAALKGSASGDATEKPAEKPSAGGAPAEGASGAPAASSSPTGSSAESTGTNREKLLELIRQLLAMGVSPEMIAQLLEAAGMAPQEAKQMIAQVSQQNAQAMGDGGAASSGNVRDPQAIAA
jgi:hypothetical protein